MRQRWCWFGSLVLSLSVIMAVSAMNPPPTPPVQWRHDYQAAIKEARQKRLPIILDFGTSNCYWCDKLDEVTFRDPRVAATLNTRFVPIKVNAEKFPQLAEALNISGFPTLVFATAEGRVLSKQVGFIDAPRMKKKLKDTLADAMNPDPAVRQVSSKPK